MFKSYLHIASRHFRKNKLLFIINIICLSIGITFAMIIGTYVLNERAVNTNLANLENQYILKSIYKEKDLGLDILSISLLARNVKEQYPNLVANYFRFNPVANTVSAGEKHFKENIAIGDTTLVSMYKLPLLHGDPSRAFLNNNSAIVTETFARKLFSTDDVVGKSISIETTVAGAKQIYQVSAVLKDIPYNTATHTIGDSYSVFIPIEGNRYFQTDQPEGNWDNTSFISFIELKPGVTPASVTGILNDMIRKNSADFVWKNLRAEMFPLNRYYLDDNNGAVKKMIIILSLIALFILLMVIINFVNINIGTSFSRLKEIGLRKTFGGLRTQLIQQFLTESLLLSFIAGFISAGLYQILRSPFSQLLNSSLPDVWNMGPSRYLLVIALLIITGMIAGTYPAFVLSRTNTIKAIKGIAVSDTRGVAFKRGLLLVQFTLAIFVFICAINLSKQVTFLLNKDIGYNKDQVLVIAALPKQWDSAGVLRMESIKQGILQLPYVKHASLTFEVPERVPPGRIVLYIPSASGDKKPLTLPIVSADKDYAKTFGIKMKSGSFFDEFTDGVVLNETAVNQLGLTIDNAIGKVIQTAAADAPITIKGVMNDFVYSSMKDLVGPIGFVHISNTYRYMAVKLQTTNITQSIADIRMKWKSFAPDAPFEYTFMDDKFRLLYKSQLQLKDAANIASILNIGIVVLGILGVVSMMIQKRLKEIAVRKVLGARAPHIILLFIKEYALIILFANIIAWPLAYMISEHLLENFAYRIQQNAWPYFMVLFLVSCVAFVLIGVQCFKVAVSNPVSRLRSE